MLLGSKVNPFSLHGLALTKFFKSIYPAEVYRKLVDAKDDERARKLIHEDWRHEAILTFLANNFLTEQERGRRDLAEKIYQESTEARELARMEVGKSITEAMFAVLDAHEHQLKVLVGVNTAAASSAMPAVTSSGRDSRETEAIREIEACQTLLLLSIGDRNATTANDQANPVPRLSFSPKKP